MNQLNTQLTQRRRGSKDYDSYVLELLNKYGGSYWSLSDFPVTTGTYRGLVKDGGSGAKNGSIIAVLGPLDMNGNIFSGV